jgi:RNA polymerase sigma factor (sigma-70 family)
MAVSQVNEVIEHLRRSALLRDGAAPTDGQLLGCFVEQRDDAAFAALVRRHGPMVWGVCRRLLDPHDAEDAFQATFLVLVRKAASVVPRERLANWLYGVAHQAALAARRSALRRRARERQVTVMPEPAVTEQDLWRDLQPLLDLELSRLPDAYREVVVLSDLEGKTRREVAHQLGLPEGTVGSRLARARALLAKRLTQRGLALSGGVLAALLSQKVASAGVPTSVVSSTIKAASLLAAGRTAATGVISVTVAALAESVLKTMLITKLKVATALLLAVVLAAAGAAGLLRQTQASEPAKAPSRSDKNEKQAARPPKEDRDRLQGTWRLVTTEFDGVRLGEGRPEIKDTRLVIEKSAATFSGLAFSGPDRVQEKFKMVGKVTLDARKNPKEITLTWEKIDLRYNNKGGKWRGIYVLDGDSLKICLTTDETARTLPRNFSARFGSNRFLWVFKREPASDKAAKPVQTPPKGEKLPPGMEAKLKWGEQVNGLRAALAIRPAPGKAKAGERPDLYLVVQNVSKAPLRFSDTTLSPKQARRELRMRGDGTPKDILTFDWPTRTDVVLQPREVAFLLLFPPDRFPPRPKDGPSAGSVIADVLLKGTRYTLVAHLHIAKAPAGAWTGKLVTGETGGAAAAGAAEEKVAQKKARPGPAGPPAASGRK